MKLLPLNFLVLILLSSASAAEFAKGGDVGWLQQMEATGYQFYDSEGKPQDCLKILKDHGMNTVRFRVFVNPSDDPQSGHCRGTEVAEMAVRAQKMGFRIMIDFHYSDTWADPGKQAKPAAWEKLSFPKLQDAVYEHTHDVLALLKTRGVTPEWVQIGNEIPNGMLWPDGRDSNPEQLAKLINAGTRAVRTINPKIKVIVHLDQGNNAEKFRRFFDNLKKYHGQYDVIGMSYYPYWIHSDYTKTIDDLGRNLNDMAARYHKKVMVVEVGGEFNKVDNTYDMLAAVIKRVRAVPGRKGLGVIYWEPQGEKSWSKYNLSCWGRDGRPTRALDAFLERKK